MISERGIILLQNQRTEKPEKGGIFKTSRKFRKMDALKCDSSNQINQILNSSFHAICSFNWKIDLLD